MWKGIAWLMLVYGMLVCATAVDVGDKQKGMQQVFAGWLANYTELKQRVEESGQEVPHMTRFEGHDPLVAISDGAAFDLQDDGMNSWLDWTPDRGRAPIDLLGLLISPGPPDANGLALRMRASYSGQLVIGVMEEDGSSYNVFPERIDREWVHYEIPLDALTLSDDSEDENDRLDVDQVNTVVLAYLDVNASGAADEERVISIDDVHFRAFHGNPLFPDFGEGPGPGMDGPGRNGRMRRGAGPGPGAGMDGTRDAETMDDGSGMKNDEMMDGTE